MSGHPIIALWSHPRSMSTAMERIMRERGDLDCLHEPFMYDYYVHRQVRTMPHFEVQADHPTSYGAIRDMILERAERAPVFFKDMSYYVYPQILKDRAFAERLTDVFLVRDPVASIPSYFRLDPGLTLEEVGLEAQARHFDALVAAGKSPPVIVAEDVRADAEGVIGALWARIGLAPCPAAFDWQRETPKDWAQVGGWHGEVSRSSGIRPLDADELAKRESDFDALARQEPRLRDLLDHHRPFYRHLAAQARS
ncbi:sulfotransferase [Defluviimonas sp. WL0075]|uniref:Sulfotransferase n=1 Tax=Albidovulum sediminicola TaxID=2984331 RepID=A0ABT2Z1N6_9RHOB|nr:sulfotransferase [Defluviimonas sp. WL0075]MCV2865054.1 sulfotransferase [Defluviimonas sp. WL0075]